MTRPRRQPGPRGDLDDDRVLRAAQELLDDGGIEAVSIRAVARALDVAPNAVYTYVASKAELINALGDRGLSHLDLGLLRTTGSPARRLVTFALHARETFLARRGLLRILVDRPIIGPSALRLNERMLAAVVDAGRDSREAQRVVYALTVFVYGWVLLEIGDVERTEETRASGLDPDAYPLTMAATAGGDPSDVSAYEDAVRRLLAGFGI